MTGGKILDEPASRLMYREDDAQFKRRLNSAIQLYWIYNTAMTILICLILSYLFKFSLLIAIIVAILFLLISNIQQTLLRVTKAHRWEIYKNHAIIPNARQGAYTLNFKEIATIERTKSLTGEKLIIKLKDGRRLGYDFGDHERPLSALETAIHHFLRLKTETKPTVVIPITPKYKGGQSRVAYRPHKEKPR